MCDLELKQITYNSKEDLSELEEMKKLMTELYDLNELQTSIQNMLIMQNENISKADTTIECSKTKIQNVNTELKQAQIYQRDYLSKMRFLLVTGALSIACPIGFVLGAKVAIVSGLICGSGAMLYTK